MSDGRFKKGEVPHNLEDLAGRRFGKWMVVARSSERNRYYLCKCDCGTVREVFGSSLTNGASPSCGCVGTALLVARFTKHGHASAGGRRSREYETWANMIARCENEKLESFQYYGGRGITICKRWRESFQAFLTDVGYRPGPGYSVDRIDVDGHYEPGNVRWTTPTQQCRNRRSNVFHTVGSETKTIAEWAEIVGISQAGFKRRIVAGFSDERILLPQMKPGPSKLPVPIH